MNQLFSSRLANHHRQLQKYLRYILNDSFVVILTFLFGGATLYYSQILKQLPTPFFLGRFVALAICILLLLVGKLATLLKPADRLFLLPKEQEMNRFLDQARNYSLILPAIVLAFGLGFLMPLIKVSLGWDLASYPMILIGLIGLKFADLQAKRQAVYQLTKQKRQMARTVWWIGSILALVGLFFVHWLIFYLIVLLVNLHFFSQQKRLQTSLIDWEFTIDSEQKRMYRIYRFINLFTDVPFIESKMRKMRGAQWLFERVSHKQTQTYSYLFIHRFMRSDEYFGQVVRLLLLGGVCLLAVDDWRFSLVVSGLFLYLITFQIIPLMTQYQSQVLTRLYPVAKEIKEKNFYAILRWVLSMSALIFILVSLLTIQLHLVPFVVLGNIVIVVILQGAYVPMRLKKMQY